MEWTCLAGHVHNYQRTFTLKYDPGSPSSPTITSNNANTYTEGNGAVFAIVGTGGVNFHALSGKHHLHQSNRMIFLVNWISKVLTMAINWKESFIEMVTMPYWTVSALQKLVILHQ